MLKYDIANERLSGKIGTTPISIRAASGGGRGSKVHPGGQPGQIGPASWNSQLKESGSTRGGPLPPGFYRVMKPAQAGGLGLAAQLEQTLTSVLYEDPGSPVGISVTKRDGFYIHGSGPKGSDGCIVIQKENFNWIMDLLKVHAPLTLEVVNPGVRMDKLPRPSPGSVA
jgi:Protein of unknown function (DUF2778)